MYYTIYIYIYMIIYYKTSDYIYIRCAGAVDNNVENNWKRHNMLHVYTSMVPIYIISCNALLFVYTYLNTYWWGFHMKAVVFF